MAVILLVEDQAICREPLAKLLEFEGFTVVTASNGVDALPILASRPIDLLLLDLILPKMSGLSLLEAIRSDARLAALPVIAVTGSMDSSQIARANELGVSELFSKARFSVDELMKGILACLSSAVTVNLPANSESQTRASASY